MVDRRDPPPPARPAAEAELVAQAQSHIDALGELLAQLRASSADAESIALLEAMQRSLDSIASRLS